MELAEIGPWAGDGVVPQVVEETHLFAGIGECLLISLLSMDMQQGNDSIENKVLEKQQSLIMKTQMNVKKAICMIE
ncbi:hypothetical protein DEO72_LG6g1818 [Vigna unguiculata]|uniref:Uncharacterized protein n=1 Tax=Vigna unguiculata TaxID=3917 RepID=A0A4D6M9F4_VIGUN|nr:hypothetical protein DEO72_LG6g1818 [Vigna unguiculata]